MVNATDFSSIISDDIATEVSNRQEETERRGELRRMRQAAGLTQGELAGLAGWSQPYVSKQERFHGTVPSRDLMEKWARACGFRVDTRIYRDGEAEAAPLVAWSV